MPADCSAIDSGVVRPQFGWGAMAVTDKGDLAYLTLRPAESADGGGTGRMYEVGVIGHGLGGDVLARQLADQIRTWDWDYRTRIVQFEIQPVDAAQPAAQFPGQFAFDRPPAPRY